MFSFHTPRPLAAVLRAACALALAAWLAGCGSQVADPSPQSPADSEPPAAQQAPAPPSTSPDAHPARPPGEPAPPATPPQQCPYRVADRCYDTRAQACQAAGCQPDRCNILESFPAQVRCSE